MNQSHEPIALGDLLPDMTTRAAGLVSLPVSETVEAGCQTCRDCGWVSMPGEVQLDGKWVYDALPCPQCRPIVVAPVGVPLGLERATFDNFDLQTFNIDLHIVRHAVLLDKIIKRHQ